MNGESWLWEEKDVFTAQEESLERWELVRRQAHLCDAAPCAAATRLSGSIKAPHCCLAVYSATTEQQRLPELQLSHQVLFVFLSLFFKKFLAKQFVLCQKAQRGKFGEAFFRSCLGAVEGCLSGKIEDRCDPGKELMFHIGKQNHRIYSSSTLVSIYWHE